MLSMRQLIAPAASGASPSAVNGFNCFSRSSCCNGTFGDSRNSCCKGGLGAKCDVIFLVDSSKVIVSTDAVGFEYAWCCVGHPTKV